MSINIISIVSIIIWIVLITELIKPSKEQNGRKIVMLLTAGSASTLILTVSFIQNIRFGIDSEITNKKYIRLGPYILEMSNMYGPFVY